MIRRSRGGGISFNQGVRGISPFLVFGVVCYALAVWMKVSFKIWIPVALAAALTEAIIVLGKLYKPFLVDKTGRCTGSRDRTKTNTMEHCRHYSRGRQYGGCDHRHETGRCHLRTR